MLPAKKLLPAIVLLLFSLLATAQEVDSTARSYHFNGEISVTNNGFSLIPTFSLGNPAAIAILSAGGDRFSLDPQFRFDLNGLKPWTFVFMWRYKLIRTEKFLLRPGLHFPAISFREKSVIIDGETREKTIPSRFFTPDLLSTYMFSEKVGIGLYYIGGLGLEEDMTRYTNFISLQAYFNRIPLSKQLYFGWNPQLYYLNMDGTGGIYAAQSVSLAHKNLPVYISSMLNVKIRSDLDTDDFDWNISLVYAFGNNYKKSK